LLFEFRSAQSFLGHRALLDSCVSYDFPCKAFLHYTGIHYFSNFWGPTRFRIRVASRTLWDKHHYF
jgi:hypothetical protein